MPAIVSHNSIVTVHSEMIIGDIARSKGDLTPQKRRLRSDKESTPMKRKLPRRCVDSSPNSPACGFEKDLDKKIASPRKSPVKRKLSDSFKPKPNWNPKDVEQMSAVMEALHVSTAPSTIVCREEEQRRVLEFCKKHVEEEKAGSLYVCGCPGTGKSLSMEKVKQHLVDWAKEAGFQSPDVLTLNCTSLTNTSEIFGKILSKVQPRKKINGPTSPLQHLQNLYSQKQQSSDLKMTLIIADELDYLITRDRAVLHDLFMLTTFPFSRCKPAVVTFRAYSKDQIIRILQERLMVRVDHMALALSNTFKSPMVDTIQSLPQHQQIILCSAVKFFRGGKKDTTVGELNKSYTDICKTSMIPPVGTLEFLSMCRVLNDQGLLKLGQSREDKLKRVTLKVDESDVSFALQVWIQFQFF
ncbi:hypothetical protein LWI29_005326 [Acer saccharum]|uniref:Cdc6 C-terminal domain-containing protein n=1 Tax=Acer saccharum TaxID=4024 RepID=A0AA39T9V6_ACESA|nr:hypothetical protein LWI29_005326 [Acer saccharum]